MRPQGVTGRVVIGCLLAAIVTLAALALAGNPRAGVAAATGLVLGSVNGLLAERALGRSMSIRMSGLGRLAILSAAAIAAGLVIGLDYAWIVLLGLGAAQMVLVGVAARAVLRR